MEKYSLIENNYVFIQMKLSYKERVIWGRDRRKKGSEIQKK